jgi:hypothetical protein
VVEGLKARTVGEVAGSGVLIGCGVSTEGAALGLTRPVVAGAEVRRGASWALLDKITPMQSTSGSDGSEKALARVVTALPPLIR